MQKRLISTAIAFIMAVNLVLVPDGAAVFTAGAAVSGDWEYVINDDGTAAVTKYNGSSLTVSVPSSLNGKTVTKIEGAFRSSWSYNSVFGSSVLSVTIPSSVKSIGDATFYDCSSLTSVTIPSSVTSIGEYAFRDCSSLVSVTIPSKVTRVADYAFYGCSSLTSLTIPNSVTSIGYSAFDGCKSLTTLTIPSNVTSIGNDAFYGCSGLTTVTIPGKVQSVGSYAFYGCYLTSVIISNGVLRIGEKAFSDSSYSWNSSTELIAAVIPKSVLFIESNAFYGCKNVSIYGIEGSYASTYADQNDIAFIKIGSTYKFDVSFKLNYSGASGAPATQKISPGFTVKKPSDPKRSGYVFAGWYRDKNCTVLWDFKDDVVKGATTLYAKWEKAPTAPKSVKAASTGAKSVKVSWNKASGAAGYEVYRATSSGGSYSKKATINSGSTTSYTNTGLTTGKTYYYKVRAFKYVNGKKVYGSYSSVKSAKPVPSKPTVSSSKTKTTVTLTWGKVSNASGYEVYRATSKSGTYKKVKTISKGSTVKYTDSSLKSGTKYYYKVRAYRTVNGKKVYGGYSSVKSVTTKK